MKYFALIGFLIATTLSLRGQSVVNPIEGKVSYITSQNVYVKFSSTEDILVGDTLYIIKDGIKTPALQVSNLSSISCVCIPLSGLKFSKDETVVAESKKLSKASNENNIPVEVATVIPATQINTVNTEPEKVELEQKVNGRLSLSSYSNFSNTPGGNSQRFRYTFSLNAQNISNSKFSAETYISFAHSNQNWDAIKSNVFNGLKIYNLAVKYEPSTNMTIILGRKINSNISNIGAIDGLQFEKRFNSFLLGAFVGSRPNYTDYSYNFNLLQFGAYGGHILANKSRGEMRNTLAFVEQKNNGKTDRRFAYFQHSNSLVKNLFLFGTAELELYQYINGQAQSSPKFTNLYLMLRYRVFKQLSLSLSYSARQNIIYYETYKDYIDRLIDETTLQGYSFQVNYRPFKFMSIGARAGYRYRKEDPRATKNLNAYLTFSQIPGIKVSTTLSATFLETAYLNGKIYSLGFSKDLLQGKVYGSVNYRYVDYNYTFYEASLVQHVGDINLSWRIIKNVSLSVTYEGTFEDVSNYNRVYFNLSTRF